MRLIFTIILFTLGFVVPAKSAEIAATITQDTDPLSFSAVWEQINHDDTAEVITWPGGYGWFVVTGTQATAEFGLAADITGGTSIVTMSELPFSSGGAYYTNVSGIDFINCFFAKKGTSLGINFSSVGNSNQDIDGRVEQVDSCP